MSHTISRISKGRSERSEKIETLKKIFSQAEGGVLTDFRGLKVSQITDLRRRFRQRQVSYRVFKNTLVKTAVRGTPLEGLAAMLEGPTGFAIGLGDPIAPARVAFEFAKENGNLKIKGGFLDGLILSDRQVTEMSRLTGKQELRAEFLSVLNAPAERLLGMLDAVPREFLGVLEAQAKQLSAAGTT